MAAPRLTRNTASFKHRPTRELSRAFRSARQQPDDAPAERVNLGPNFGHDPSKPVFVTLTQVLDAFLGQADAATYLVLARRVDDVSIYDFDSGVHIENLEAKQNFAAVRGYISESFNDILSEQACANLILKIVVEIYGKILDSFPMNSEDKIKLEHISKTGGSLRADFPTKRVGAVEVRVSEDLLRDVPLSIRKVYEASAAWATAKEEMKDWHQGGGLKAFSLM